MRVCPLWAAGNYKGESQATERAHRVRTCVTLYMSTCHVPCRELQHLNSNMAPFMFFTAMRMHTKLTTGYYTFRRASLPCPALPTWVHPAPRAPRSSLPPHAANPPPPS